MLYINWKINQCWLHWYKNSNNSLNCYRVIVSIATLSIGTRGILISSFITTMMLGVLINFDELDSQFFQKIL